MSLRVIGIIPARGGSKGVPRKNIRMLAGKPLLAYTAEAALAAHRLDHVILSTDDEEIAAVGRSLGLDVPFLRPPELAQDSTPTLPVLRHAIAWLESHDRRYDAVCLLQPSSPFRASGMIDGCIELLEGSGTDSVVTVLAVPAAHNPHWVYLADEGGRLRLSTGESAPVPRRQDLPTAWHREGSVYLTRRDVLMEQNSLYGSNLIGYALTGSRSVNIDSPEDWARAEEILSGEPVHV